MTSFGWQETILRNCNIAPGKRHKFHISLNRARDEMLRGMLEQQKRCNILLALIGLSLSGIFVWAIFRAAP